MISIGTNASALMAQAATASAQIDAETAMQRLSSGKRINAAKDDAAGVAIASRMTSHVRGLHQSIRNSMDAQALVSTAEGGLQKMEVLLQRIRELAVQASNDTNSDADRTNLNNEAQQLLEGIDAIASGVSITLLPLLRAFSLLRYVSAVLTPKPRVLIEERRLC